VAALGQHWQLLLRLGVIQHQEVNQLIEGEVVPAINTIILQRVDAFKDSTAARKFDTAQRQLNQLESITSHLPGAPLLCNINSLKEHLRLAIAKKDDDKAFQEQIEKLTAEVAETRRKLEENNKQGYWGRIVGTTAGFLTGGPGGALLGYELGNQIDKD
jgi:hypothetical protein